MKCVCPMGGDRTCPDDCLLAIWANLPATDRKTRRKPVAEQLYKQGFTQEQIATQLGVSQQQISKDLEGLQPSSKPPRPKGGRPKGKRQTKVRTAPAPVDAQKVAAAVLDEGKTLEQAAAEHGVTSVQHVKLAVAKEEGRREPKAERADLSLTAQQKFDAALRAYKHKLDMEFEERCREQCRLWLDEVSLPQYLKEITKLEHSILTREGVMDRVTYQKIRACLHPDRVQDPALKKRYEEAFRLFTDLEKRVLNEKESPTALKPMPRTYADLMAMKAKVQAERKAKRHEKSTIRTR